MAEAHRRLEPGRPSASGGPGPVFGRAPTGKPDTEGDCGRTRPVHHRPERTPSAQLRSRCETATGGNCCPKSCGRGSAQEHPDDRARPASARPRSRAAWRRSSTPPSSRSRRPSSPRSATSAATWSRSSAIWSRSRSACSTAQRHGAGQGRGHTGCRAAPGRPPGRTACRRKSRRATAARSPRTRPTPDDEAALQRQETGRRAPGPARAQAASCNS